MQNWIKSNIMAARLSFVLFVTVGAIAVLSTYLFDSPNTIRAFQPKAKPTPTINKKINSRYLENHRASDFAFSNQDGIAKAAAYVRCSSEGDILDGSPPSAIVRSFNNVNGVPFTIANGTGISRCTIDFGFPLIDRYLVVTPVSQTGGGVTEINETLASIAGGGGSTYFYVVVY